MKATELLVGILLGPGLFLLACDTGSGDTDPDPQRCACEDCDPSCGDCLASGCAPGAPGFRGPVLLWAGPHADAPPCPRGAPAVIYEGHDGLSATQSCPSCSCGDPACLFPEGVYLSELLVCPPFESPENALVFASPEGWDGSCVSPGNFPPAQATTIKFLPTRVRGCAPSAGPEPAATSISWATLARACSPIDEAAAPEPLPPGFARCVFQEGEPGACPPRYPERRVFYGRAEDTTRCTPCSCGPPEGSSCVAFVEVHDTPTCSTFVSSGMLVDNIIEEGELACMMELSGQDMGPEGLQATMTTDLPGACAPAGGEPAGEARPADPATFCCEPPP